MALFKVNTAGVTSISVGEENIPVIDGCVDVPVEVGEGQGWHRLDEAEVAAFNEKRAADLAKSEDDEDDEDEDKNEDEEED